MSTVCESISLSYSIDSMFFFFAGKEAIRGSISMATVSPQTNFSYLALSTENFYAACLVVPPKCYITAQM